MYLDLRREDVTTIIMGAYSLRATLLGVGAGFALSVGTLITLGAISFWDWVAGISELVAGFGLLWGMRREYRYVASLARKVEQKWGKPKP